AALLDALHAAGFRQAIGSAAPGGNLALLLAMIDAARHFVAPVPAEDTQRGKPDPQGFLIPAGGLGGAPARWVVFEDAVAGVEAAKNGGMKAVAVRFVAHHPEEKLRQAGADLIVASLEEVTVETVRALLGG